MKSIAVTEFKARCLALLEDVARTGETLLITKRGKPLARVSPGANSNAISPQDTLQGTVQILGDIVEPIVPVGAWNARRGVLLTQEDAPRRARARARRPKA